MKSLAALLLLVLATAPAWAAAGDYTSRRSLLQVDPDDEVDDGNYCPTSGNPKFCPAIGTMPRGVPTTPGTPKGKKQIILPPAQPINSENCFDFIQTQACKLEGSGPSATITPPEITVTKVKQCYARKTSDLRLSPSGVTCGVSLFGTKPNRNPVRAFYGESMTVNQVYSCVPDNPTDPKSWTATIKVFVAAGRFSNQGIAPGGCHSWSGLVADCQKCEMTFQIPCSCQTTTRIQDDPHITGFDGQDFDFFGSDGRIFNIMSEARFQVNALFSNLGNALIANNYMTLMGLRFGESKIAVEAVGNSRVAVYLADQLVTPYMVPNQAFKVKGTNIILKLTQGPSATSNDTAQAVTIMHPLVTFVVTGERAWINIQSQLQDASITDMHGVIGQTWRSGKPFTLPVVNGEVQWEGREEDYVVHDGLFGTSSAFSMYNQAMALAASPVEEARTEVPRRRAIELGQEAFAADAFLESLDGAVEPAGHVLAEAKLVRSRFTL